MKWYLMVLNRYFDFNGRSSRTEYWMFVLINFFFTFLLFLLDYVIITSNNGLEFPPFSTFYSLIMFIPSISVGVRRLHDVGKSGWMMFLPLIPLIGSIWILILFIKESDQGSNKYGENPKTLFQENKKLDIKKDEFEDDSKSENRKQTYTSSENYKSKKTTINPLIKTILISFFSILIILVFIVYLLMNGSEKKDTVEKINEIEKILENRKKDPGEYPDELKEITVNRPMRISLIKDYWGNEFHYEKTNNGENYILISKGKDGILGTSDDLNKNDYNSK